MEDLHERVRADTRCVVLGMQGLLLMDTSGLEALRQLQRALRRRGVSLRLAEAEEQPLSLMRRAGFAAALDGGVAPTVAQAVACVAAPPPVPAPEAP